MVAAALPGRAELAELAVELSAGAAAVVAAAPAHGVSTKSSVSDLVTEVDRAAEAQLVAELVRRRPDDAVLGEEGAARSGTSGIEWVLDPIDGTTNFVLGLPHYAVSVAAVVDGQVVAGAVADPVSGEIFHAYRGGGARCASQTASKTASRTLRGPRDVPLDRAVVATGFGYDPELRTRQAAVVAPLLGLVADIRRLGAAALDLCWLAAGRVDAYFETGLNRWDWAAGALIAAEAGCVLRGPDGGPPARGLVLGAAPRLATELAAALAAAGVAGAAPAG